MKRRVMKCMTVVWNNLNIQIHYPDLYPFCNNWNDYSIHVALPSLTETSHDQD